MAEFRDRIVELRRVPASTLRHNPENWRRHPEPQTKAMRAILEDVGFAGAVLARETDVGLELIDGHLRQEIAGRVLTAAASATDEKSALHIWFGSSMMRPVLDAIDAGGWDLADAETEKAT